MPLRASERDENEGLLILRQARPSTGSG
jgi:hypothetical protein